MLAHLRQIQPEKKAKMLRRGSSLIEDAKLVTRRNKGAVGLNEIGFSLPIGLLEATIGPSPWSHLEQVNHHPRSETTSVLTSSYWRLDTRLFNTREILYLLPQDKCGLTAFGNNLAISAEHTVSAYLRQIQREKKAKMIRTGSSLIDDAKLVTRRNKAKISHQLSDTNDHEFLIYSGTGSDELSMSFVASCLEKCGAEAKILETKTREDIVESIENGQIATKEIYVKCECSYPDLTLVEQMITENPRLRLKRLTSLGGYPSARHPDLDFCHHLKEKDDGDAITEEHPGFRDQNYVERRRAITEIASEYKHGKPIPTVKYTQQEEETWRKVYSTLRPLHALGACAQYKKVIDELECCGLYTEYKIPQMEDVSNYLKSQSGFRLRPVAGLVSPRDFLASLAVKVFQCTQYVRHHLSPMHTPEPDCCHELIGHVPMLCDPEFARFSQEIGIISLGVSDEDVEKLASLYWFTVEYGLCKQDGEIKAYGAGILSSYGELEHAMSGKPELVEFDCEKASRQSYQDNDYQPLYFVATSFEDALTNMREFTLRSIERPFKAQYDSSRGRVEIFSKRNLQDIARAVEQLRNQVELVKDLVD